MIRTATPADEPALHALWADCFDDAPHLPALHALDDGHHHRTFVAARHDGTLDAVVVYVPRTVRDAHGIPHRVGGIGSVATRPEARGRGLVRGLLAAATATMLTEGCAWSLLFTDTPRVYGSSGWRTFPRPYAEGPLAEAQDAPTRVRAALPDDIDAVVRLQAEANARRPLSCVRSADDWRGRVPSWYGPDTLSLVTEDPEGAMRGWLVARTGGGAADVLEAAVADEGALGELYAGLAVRARAAGASRARTRLPVTPVAERALPRLVRSGAVTHGTDTTGMYRPLLAPARSVERTLGAAGAAYWYGDSF
ncbi:GNAT family N-acetyltransferase [Streptomyces sp. VRA16 Mangrove soil]|uniref:GNAT family N-acetyltransferase n=1 Tax=Streptomyces sp. VRA16 Mangrove soil TaxID=2817434 RepID=UPI001A9E1180|nr:GNAT family N-acetyltransferase [Streptomyces sp. VRA16 Mangrove soil]MBO1330074.1 GNAT family N-acetyltransferase [Streptomyces sp. VRA16 Mangrove soil]